ncbi:ABC transporter substrate-binding protein [Kovacikia minuta CCNUW1]|uniref:ABC transporter substrate-binding protein n=1 Tax=Kovacikia minuta TaxID=2931930 RepID=UPI001CCA82F0|nr:ABC transporter substrate-binding protein [Kovacikia minuta CCNUW1]
MPLLQLLNRFLVKHWRQSQLWRRLSLLVIFVFGVVLAIGPVFSQQTVTLKLLMTAPDAPPWNNVMVKQFEEKYPRIKLQIVEGPNATNLVEDLYTSAFLLGDSPYDLINMDVIWTPKFAAAGWLMDLTDEFSQAELAVFSSPDVEGGRYQDRLYRLPVRSDAGMLYYRKDLLEKAGYQPPQTFEELVKISRDIQQKGLARWGYLWQGRQYEGAAAMFVEVLQGFGGFWVNPETLEVGLDKPEAIQAIQFLLGTVSQGVSPPGVTTYMEEDTRRIFQSGEAVFLRSWPYVWPLANADNSPIKGKVGIMPLIPSQGHQGGSCLGGWGLGISKTTQHPKEALQAIRFVTSQAAQKNFILEAGYVPSRKELFADPQVLAKYRYYPELLKVVQKAVLRPSIAQYAQASDILQRYLSAALTNQQTPEAAMESCRE